jgi:hypothetical protein
MMRRLTHRVLAHKRLVVIGWVVATVISQRVIAQHRAADPHAYVALSEISPAAYRGAGVRAPLQLAADLVRFLRLRNRTAYGLYLLAPDTARGLRQQPLRLYATRLRALLLAERLRGGPMMADDAVTAALEAHAPTGSG